MEVRQKHFDVLPGNVVVLHCAVDRFGTAHDRVARVDEQGSSTRLDNGKQVKAIREIEVLDGIAAMEDARQVLLHEEPIVR